MHSDSMLYVMFLVFSGAAIFATVALYARQTLIVSYIVLGVVLGPSLLGWVTDATLIREVADIGIMFLLFLLGLNMHPQKLFRILGSASIVTGLSSLIFGGIGYVAGLLLGFHWIESLIVGAGLMFSSTIVGLKLLPTTVLHHRHTGEVMISILLLQDIIAIVLLLVLRAGIGGETLMTDVAGLVLALIGICILAWLVERFVLIPLIARFDVIQEYIFLLAIGWCLGLAELSVWFGLSHEIGAFVAGVALASSRISLFIAENLKPLRDFFLIIFFFMLGAGLDLHLLLDVLVPAAILAAVVLLVKPFVFVRLLVRTGESPPRAKEMGLRLGQGSEFSLLIAVLALETGVLRSQAAHLLELTTILSMMVSMYLIVWRYPTPIAISDELRRS
ncbi:MAG: sodium:proton antiporter [Candidatus Muproteobacteria bacterium RIFCSPHIGHO2_12_FULL_60_33]|uniref:Sodium:proton antiporter n=1 Tax=Candidatus Muproteobacteria bacterium RIFCSPLOWO2_01_FULL_60_18 TaxID=1817768 RepID=A0A1F6U0C5_9PROT|nr:MAG: sodium:proton antiporter [Candidatus Muproteobacteria bacterium RIFCSPHIGHO2_01_60_12]OGI50772.1 MAG: sodium:proton antiporter [Candidatus Muproteobacteria bacterium RIFCSPLOWO2_01_FULL_60_18]OGI54708.1 MAG: sodium:proton antiporter [Candidatus Muproteobacteria bacterium RIFCSPHIGHO2_12_FULL_60_33]OGI55904.1 MAG: sodium:proton antiporter [Candidatus Muproteobacteria bacterium RIFCSPHIGHO2_02_FULL_60_13]OGI59010.1 MAG: sodium:proton antiporter [Candidatus Muproteobacteria bacterium RIFCS